MTVIQEIMKDSPALYWPLDETSGTTINDVSGGGANGVATSAARLANADGLFGRVGSTLGTVQLGGREGLALPAGVAFGNGARSLGGWCYRADTDNGSFMSYGVQAGAEIVTMNVPGAAIGGLFYLFSDGINAGNNQSMATNPTPLGQWFHYFWTYAGGAGGAMLFYVDGELVKSGTATLNTTTGTAGNTAFRVGLRRDDANGGYYDGKAAHVAIFPGALTQARIRAQMKAAQRMGVVY